MTLCFVNQFHPFHFGLISRDCTFEELGSIVHGTELFDSTFTTYLVLIQIYKLNSDNPSAVELINLQYAQSKLEVGV